MRTIWSIACCAGLAAAFPFVAKQEGIKNAHILRRQQVINLFVSHLYQSFVALADWNSTHPERWLSTRRSCELSFQSEP